MSFWTSFIQAIESFIKYVMQLLGMTSATGKVTANVTLLDSGGNPVASQAVPVTYVPTGSSGATPVTLGTATTNSTGQGSTSGNVPAPGTYDFTASYAGETGVYAAATPVTVTGVKVVAGTALTLAIVLV